MTNYRHESFLFEAALKALFTCILPSILYLADVNPRPVPDTKHQVIVFRINSFHKHSVYKLFRTTDHNVGIPCICAGQKAVHDLAYPTNKN